MHAHHVITNYDHEHVHERSSGLSWSMKFAHMREIATALGQAKPSRVFFLRYEDICDNAKGVMDALRTWLPTLQGFDITKLPSSPSNNRRLSHELMSIPDYCRQIALPSWPKLPFMSVDPDAMRLLGYFGYLLGL